MKEMEAKTENRYEYRKPQEKRKQMIAPDLFEFAYVPDWYGHLAELERLALPESWKFRKPSRETKNADTPILERYIHTIFRKQVIDFNSESDPRKADSIFHLENECVCFHTGLYTPQYKGIYGYFERNNFSDSLRDWYFRGFCDELSPKLRYIEPLPQKPVYHMVCLCVRKCSRMRKPCFVSEMVQNRGMTKHTLVMVSALHILRVIPEGEGLEKAVPRH